jgi:predicted amidophosphoribosyltransferase
MFGEFKLGERDYAYPLALGMFSALTICGELEFDAIIPIPLSPDKHAAGELHRTKALSQELARLLGGVAIREYLSLSEPVSKRRMLSDGYTLAQFRSRYFAALRTQQAVCNLHKVLLVDDVITRGTTISCAIRRLREINPRLEIAIVSAGQMIVKSAVLNESGFVA